MQRLAKGICTAIVCLSLTPAIADENGQKTIEQLFLQKDQLKGQQVTFHGKVVKVTNHVMNRNFLHIQDGSGQDGTNDVTVTSDQTAEIGDEVTITGTVAVDLDFSAGYTYPLLIEKATIAASGH